MAPTTTVAAAGASRLAAETDTLVSDPRGVATMPCGSFCVTQGV